MGPPQHTVSMHQQVAAQQGQVIQTQGAQVLAAQSGSTTITTMSPLQQSQTAHQQQISADWSHGRAVQVIQQPIQNPAYLQQLYNTQGVQGQLLMPSNIALHPSLNPSQIQVSNKIHHYQMHSQKSYNLKESFNCNRIFSTTLFYVLKEMIEIQNYFKR